MACKKVYISKSTAFKCVELTIKRQNVFTEQKVYKKKGGNVGKITANFLKKGTYKMFNKGLTFYFVALILKVTYIA